MPDGRRPVQPGRPGPRATIIIRQFLYRTRREAPPAVERRPSSRLRSRRPLGSTRDVSSEVPPSAGWRAPRARLVASRSCSSSPSPQVKSPASPSEAYGTSAACAAAAAPPPAAAVQGGDWPSLNPALPRPSSCPGPRLVPRLAPRLDSARPLSLTCRAGQSDELRCRPPREGGPPLPPSRAGKPGGSQPSARAVLFFP